jgi:hypothetical protein
VTRSESGRDGFGKLGSAGTFLDLPSAMVEASAVGGAVAANGVNAFTAVLYAQGGDNVA